MSLRALPPAPKPIHPPIPPSYTPPGPTQLYREKMEGVDAWLHSASVPRNLKHKIRAFYAGWLTA